MGNLARLRPLSGVEEYKALKELASADDHAVLAPTLVIEKCGEIVGYVSLNAVPWWTGWFHSTKLYARDTIHLVNDVENLLRPAGHKLVVTLVAPESPFRPVMEKFGYAPAGEAMIGLKQL